MTCLLFAPLTLAACSLFYEMGQGHADQQCNQQPPGAREECRQRINKQPYKDYERERRKAAGEQR